MIYENGLMTVLMCYSIVDEGVELGVNLELEVAEDWSASYLLPHAPTFGGSSFWGRGPHTPKTSMNSLGDKI